MKIALAQLNYHIGNFQKNAKKIIDHIHKAKENRADLVVFSELAVCGYPPQDLLERSDFVEDTFACLDSIRKEVKDIAVIIGAPSLNPNSKGKNLYNSAYFIENEKIQLVQHKTLLPDYDVFDECRYFEPNDKFHTIKYKGYRIALTICEDLWDKLPQQNNFAKTELYTTSPLKRLMKDNPDIVINIAASPFSYDRDDTRTTILGDVCKKYGVPLVYVNQVGAHAELIFDGDSRVFSDKGEVKLQLPSFEEDFQIFDFEKIHEIDTLPLQKTNDMELIHDGLVLGVKDYFAKNGFKKALIGLSGGIDSAVTFVIVQRALGSENVHAILMPSEFSSDHSVDDAKKLAENVDVSYDIISIKKSYDAVVNTMTPVFKDLPFNVAEENIQARLRGLILMAYSNKFAHLVLNTSNKSEMAVGYGTLYGDMAGALSVLGDVYKTKVFELARYMNKDGEVVPEHTIVKPPSAELRPNQKDSDSLPDYDLLDKILYRFIEQNASIEDILQEGFAEDVVRRVIRLVNLNEYKRYQAAPVLRVTTKSFGIGRRIPLVHKF
ncbi:NH(3)-dependent NAD(+) synthetase [Balneicella halophila]|uniref:Glutamine-dependent NAD(+) synthetase n=1 Tax=Balneicella halophila TaxID=1537566 RepID=A0A7L4URS6_BALHA|nr:NAD+ synthase [Balneicella halophila]PVX52485.1 NH(3)-dependent NAD(+) synthetase [Balneicella halophila]